MSQERITWQGQQFQRFPDFPHEWIYTLAKNAIHFASIFGAAQQGLGKTQRRAEAALSLWVSSDNYTRGFPVFLTGKYDGEFV
jgi:hypothetical protein